MQVRDGGHIQGVAGEGARAETAHVVGEMGDYLFDDFRGEP